MKFEKDATYVVALGGLGEVGKNMYAFMHNNEIFIIDAGVMFPESDLLGVDYVIQDTTFLKENNDKIKGLIITHGHEDHIGGISFLLQNIEIPVIYAPKIAADLIEKKLVDRNITYKNMVIINEDYNIKTKYFNIEFVSITHSIPDSYAVVLHTPNGVIFETGDYKFDLMVMLIGGGFLGASNWLNAVLTIMRKQNYMLIGYGLVSLLALIFMNLVTGKYGVNGVSVLFSLLMLLLMFVFIAIYLIGLRRRKHE